LRKSWVTQRIANRVPVWSDARLLPHSILQQFVSPMGMAIEDLYKYVISETNNLFLTTANIDLADVVYKVNLPNDFEFSIDSNNLASPLSFVPKVKAIDGSTTIWIEPSSENTIESFWHDSYPTRVIDEYENVILDSVMDATALSDLDDAVLNDISNPTRLSITIVGATDFVNTKRRQPFSFIALTGTTERELEEVEFIPIPYNGVFTTVKIWQELTSVEYWGLSPDSATIQIEPFAFNVSREVDKYQLYVDPFTEKLLYHTLGSKVLNISGPYYSTLKHLTVIANTLNELYSGQDTLQTIREIELLYNGNNLVLNDMAIQPFTNRIFAIDDEYLYIFSPSSDLPDFKDMQDRTEGPSMIIETDFIDYIRGETISMAPYWKKATTRIFWNRWSVTKPDGVKRYVDFDGSESTNAENVKIFNELYSELAFGPFVSANDSLGSKYEIDYIFTEYGTYKFALETMYADGTLEKDILPVRVHHKNADTRLRLPSRVRGASGIAFDSNQKLWLLKQRSGMNTAHRVRLAVDNMFIDFENKAVYLHEEYDSVTVYKT
jgi:hypothetical protein